MALAAVSSVKATPRVPMSSLNSAAETRPSPSLSSMAKVVAYLSVSTIVVVASPSLGVLLWDRTHDRPAQSSWSSVGAAAVAGANQGTGPADGGPPPCRRAPDDGSTASSRSRPTTPDPDRRLRDTTLTGTSVMLAGDARPIRSRGAVGLAVRGRSGGGGPWWVAIERRAARYPARAARPVWRASWLVTLWAPQARSSVLLRRRPVASDCADPVDVGELA